MLRRITCAVALIAVEACGGVAEFKEEEQSGLLPPRACAASFAECDGDVASRCETDLTSSPANCGACGRTCEGGLACARGECLPPQRVVQVAAGSFATCARRASGQVLCWGGNAHGQLGDGSTEDRLAPLPARVSGAVDLRNALPGFCTRTAAGTLSCWGDGVPNLEIDRVVDFGSFVDLSDSTFCALRTDGDVWCIGTNRCGELGLGSVSPTVATTALRSLARDAVSIGVGHAACVARRDGSVSCWGAWTALGGGPAAALDGCAYGAGRSRPSDVTSVRDAVAVRGIGIGGMCAIRVGGTVDCWGPWWSGFDAPLVTQFPERYPGAHTLRTIAGLRDVVKIEGAGPYHACALHRDGGVSCWATGDGTPPEVLGGVKREDQLRATAFRLPELHDIVDLSVGAQHACAVSRDGGVKCWGSNGHGELGDGTIADFKPGFVVPRGL